MTEMLLSCTAVQLKQQQQSYCCVRSLLKETSSCALQTQGRGSVFAHTLLYDCSIVQCISNSVRIRHFERDLMSGVFTYLVEFCLSKREQGYLNSCGTTHCTEVS